MLVCPLSSEPVEVLIRLALTRHGYDVILAATGTEAIEIAADRSVEVDVVITDVVMPGMMGREVSERMSELRPETPLIYVSGYAKGFSTPKTAWSPGGALLEKPFSETELLTVVREALGGKSETDHPGSFQHA